ncbi:MAG TPA: Ycf66 family protein [Leptolyngbya sp.]|nr:Ycf66 family protein [Leptolyngbya sp.]
MLTYVLALAIVLGSLGLYLSAFFYPDIYRKGDLTLSGVGLFYGLVLWFCADRITGAVLLGQIASVSLIGWFGYQSLTYRLGYTPSTAELQSKFSEVVNSESTSKVLNQGKQTFASVRDRIQSLLNKTPAKPSEPYEPLKREDFGNPTPPTPEASKTDVMGAIGAVTNTIGGLFKKPAQNKEVYVRKDFREAPEPDDAIDDKEDSVTSKQGVEPNPVPIDQEGASKSTHTADKIAGENIEFEANHPQTGSSSTPEQTDEVGSEAVESEADHPQAIPPHPPTAELVEDAIADAEEKHLPAHPPEPEA